jgi:DNA repair protein RadC
MTQLKETIAEYSFKAEVPKSIEDFYEAIKKEHTFVRNQYDIEKQCLDMQLMSREVCRVFFLDGQNRILGSMDFFGSTDHCTIYPRDIFYQAMVRDATTIAMAHNHPGGSSQASQADWDLTHRIGRIGKELDIKLIDHVIMYGDGIQSMRALSRWVD